MSELVKLKMKHGGIRNRVTISMQRLVCGEKFAAWGIGCPHKDRVTDFGTIKVGKLERRNWAALVQIWYLYFISDLI